ncbi:hypothetical protein EGH67_10550 [Klebsiella aerogenes]|nr:hypothetical protein EGH60_10470 [Klebsiella aerogenes]RSV75203.1 hypothetical protein EGH59_04635 [Klebsiella aerogenes]RSV78171.1 hypothetical protein EGH58_13710 [Klebsiella aerogenes]RSW03688.1 hypothetical protein EGH52_11480 [Klebsiella aerogenes]RSW03741.1 hypothetical protein EGH54_10725 [Klebsiella aerogenes]
MPAMLARRSDEAQSVRQRFFIFIIAIPFQRVGKAYRNKLQVADTLQILNGEARTGNYLFLFSHYEI